MEKRKLKLAATSFIFRSVAADFSLRFSTSYQPDLVLHLIKQALLQTARPSGAKTGSVGVKLFVVTAYPQK